MNKYKIINGVKLTKAEKRSLIVYNIVKKFTEKGMSNPHLERVLDIPQRTIEKEKDNPSPELVALLRIINLFPWMLEVADNNFDPDFIKNNFGGKNVRK